MESALIEESHNTLGIIVSGIVFAVTYIAIFTEKVNRTIAGFVGAVLMVITGMIFGFYSQSSALKAIDANTILLLFGMMMVVAMLKKTGFFNYLAIWTAKKTKGDPWKLTLYFGVVTTIVSMFLDNVTTIIIIAPITILVAKMLGISAIPMLMAEALLSDTGGVATLVGDPPNIMIGSAAGYNFNYFLIHMGPVVFTALVLTTISLKIIYRKDLAKKPQNIDALMRMNERDSIKDPRDLKKVLFALMIIIILFFIHHHLHLLPSFVALIGTAIALALLRPDIDEILHDVEWSVLLFFISLFVCVGGIEHSGLIGKIANYIVNIGSSNEVLLFLIVLFGSAIMSAIVDNIPFTMAMIPVIQTLKQHGMDVDFLWWALALGVGFGGNGTPIGSTANVITVSMSEKTDTPITFKTWFKSGSIVMAVTCLSGAIFVLIFFSFYK
jgi:Na+/H+ antiporter NhaD/arsenite permease-like protein